MPLTSLSDVEIHYETCGEPRPAGPSVLLIHGLGSSGADWAFQVPALQTDFQTILPDLRGSGLSGKPPGPYSIRLFAEDLWSVLDHLQVRKCHLVGFSLGGAVALEMALQRPEAARKLVMINALPSYRINHWRKWIDAHTQIALVRCLGLPRAARVIGRRLFPEPHQAAMRRRVEQVVGRNARRPYLDTLRALMGWCAAERLSELQADSLLLSAEFDYTPAQEKRNWAEQMGARFVPVAGSRHGTPFDAISATNTVLTRFLSSEDPLPTYLAIDGPADTPSAAPDLF